MPSALKRPASSKRPAAANAKKFSSQLESASQNNSALSLSTTPSETATVPLAVMPQSDSPNVYSPPSIQSSAELVDGMPQPEYYKYTCYCKGKFIFEVASGLELRPWKMYLCVDCIENPPPTGGPVRLPNLFHTGEKPSPDLKRSNAEEWESFIGSPNTSNAECADCGIRTSTSCVTISSKLPDCPLRCPHCGEVLQVSTGQCVMRRPAGAVASYVSRTVRLKSCCVRSKISSVAMHQP